MELIEKIGIGIGIAAIIVFIIFAVYSETKEVKPEQEFPITKRVDMNDFMADEYNLECDGINWSHEYTEEIPFNKGCYGYCGSVGEPLGSHGVMGFVYRINPNTGWIWQLSCNEDYLDDCPDRINNFPSDEPEGKCKGCFVYDECRITLE